MNGDAPSTANCAREAMRDLTAELAALDDMKVSELHAQWLEVFGEAARSRNKPYLIKRIAYRIQEIAEGGLDAESLAKIDELTETTPVRQRPRRRKSKTAETEIAAATVAAATTGAKPRDPRLPPVGTALKRSFKGVEHEVTVLDDGFELAGERFRSLSAIAKKITGTSWNGWTFFGLTGRAKKEKS